MSVGCSRCGVEWERDPALEVECPTCEADEGSGCRRPSGHPAMGVHADRDRRALREVDGYEPCDHATQDTTSGHGEVQRSLDL